MSVTSTPLDAADRLKLVREHFSITQKQLATELDVSRSYIGDVENRRIPPSKKLKTRLMTIYNVRGAWLDYGEGRMLASAQSQAPVEEMAVPGYAKLDQTSRVYAGMREPAQNYLPSQGRRALSRSINRDIAWIPQLQTGAATEVGPSGEHIEDKTLAFRLDWIRQRGLDVNELTLVEVTGDSMEDKLQAGDVVLVDRSQRQPVSGKAFVFMTGTDLQVKYVQLLPNGSIQVSSHNQAYSPFEVSQRDLEQENTVIIGRVVASQNIWR